MSALAGGCACGAVRYRVDAEPAFSIHCFCRQCQRITGAGHASQFGVPTAAVTLDGELKDFYLKADSGNRITSSFCPNCGSPVLKRSAGYPQMVFFHAATLDDPSLFKPQQAAWLEKRHAWDFVDPALA